MHAKQTTSGAFKNVFLAAWLVLAWLCCTVASAATSVSVAATPSAVVAPADVTLSVVVSADPNPVTVARVKYVNGNSLMGETTTAPFSLNVSNLGPGNYVIKAYVWLADASNTMLVSAPVALTITGGTAASAAVYYIHTDQLNTPRVIADQNQAVVWKWEGDGFGSVPPNEQPGAAAKFEFNPRFAGQYFDRESGLHYNYFRDYDPQTGRYVQSDPIGLNGGINTYAYVGASPLLYSDPLGLDPGDRFRSEGAAANDAKNFINAIPEAAKMEMSVSIYKQPDGSYSYTDVITQGNPVGVIPDASSPPGTMITSDYHNHIPVPPNGMVVLPDGRRVRITEDGQNNFSAQDIAAADEYGVTLYMSGPNGKMNRYRPKKRKGYIPYGKRNSSYAQSCENN